MVFLVEEQLISARIMRLRWNRDLLDTFSTGRLNADSSAPLLITTGSTAVPRRFPFAVLLPVVGIVPGNGTPSSLSEVDTSAARFELVGEDL
jgi:hypothetical protein